jgi:hypothetical protein
LAHDVGQDDDIPCWIAVNIGSGIDPSSTKRLNLCSERLSGSNASILEGMNKRDEMRVPYMSIRLIVPSGELALAISPDKRYCRESWTKTLLPTQSAHLVCRFSGEEFQRYDIKKRLGNSVLDM